MDPNLVFGFPSEGGWLYNAPKQWSRRSLPQELEDVFQKSKVKDIKCAAFGITRNSYFLSWVNQDSEPKFTWGPDCPEEFLSYLKNPKTGKVRQSSLNVVFGPDDSFFAWDNASMRWFNIPEGLERCIQSWLGPAGWTRGPPRLVALGADGAWFAMSQYGAWAYMIPDSWTELNQDWDSMNIKEMCGKDEILAVSFSATHIDRYVIVVKDRFAFCYNVPDPVEDLLTVVDSLVSEDIQKARQEWRERMRQEQAEEEAHQERERLAREEEEERIRFEKQEALREKLMLHYVLWKSGYETAMSRDKTLTTFPHLPVAVCTCREMACSLVKNRDDSLRACQHDVEQLLRASGCYSLDWLRKERLQWHPDKFARHCDPDFRRILTGKATELYSIFELLIEAEKAFVEGG